MDDASSDFSVSAGFDPAACFFRVKRTALRRLTPAAPGDEVAPVLGLPLLAGVDGVSLLLDNSGHYYSTSLQLTISVT